MQELCDLQPFIEQSLDGIEPCKTCFFPSYPGINSINLDAYKPMDFTEQWIYFHGDSTLRQVYGEFYGIIHKTQVALFQRSKSRLRVCSMHFTLCIRIKSCCRQQNDMLLLRSRLHLAEVAASSLPCDKSDLTGIAGLQ